MKLSQVFVFASASVIPSFLGLGAHAYENLPQPQPGVQLELNAMQDEGGACRLSFLAQNTHDTTIESAVYETVLFDSDGQVMMLTLFDFQDLPADRLRVRQFDLGSTACDSIGRILINGAHECSVAGASSTACEDGLSLTSRADMELLG